jgi:hypothetical protein
MVQQCLLCALSVFGDIFRTCGVCARCSDVNRLQSLCLNQCKYFSNKTVRYVNFCLFTKYLTVTRDREKAETYPRLKDIFNIDVVALQ